MTAVAEKQIQPEGDNNTGVIVGSVVGVLAIAAIVIVVVVIVRSVQGQLVASIGWDGDGRGYHLPTGRDVLRQKDIFIRIAVSSARLQTDSQTNKQTDRQTNRHTDRHTDTQANTQIYR